MARSVIASASATWDESRSCIQALRRFIVSGDFEKYRGSGNSPHHGGHQIPGDALPPRRWRDRQGQYFRLTAGGPGHDEPAPLIDEAERAWHAQHVGEGPGVPLFTIREGCRV